MPQHDLAVLVEVLAEAQQIGRAVQQRRQPVLAGDERLGPQVLAVEVEKIEEVVAEAVGRFADRSACSAEKSEAPPAPSTTSSPSRIAVLQGRAARAPPRSAPKRGVKS